MAKSWFSSLFFSLLIALLAVNAHCNGDKKVHVVYMGERLKDGLSASSLHQSMLSNVVGSSGAKESLVYSYTRSFNGFAAKLSDEEAETLAEMDGVVSVLPNRIFKLHTTRSWDFTGLPQTQSGGSSGQGDIIVGLIDTGAWPEADSFSDEGFGPPPTKWKGSCAANFTCNNKLVGARMYNSENFSAPTDIQSPRDSEGHGTHTASTAAGRDVSSASYYGLGEGVARGAVPEARIAVYKVCWSYGCALADILAGFDDAIADGVDIISVSLGSSEVLQYFEDPIAIGSFHAMKWGILTSNSAGNSGPLPYSVLNYAPWSLTVAASTIDRKFVANVVLGNGQILLGNSINSFALNGSSFPLIYGGDAPNVSAGASPDISRYCYPGTLNENKVKGKIVLCDTLYDGSNIMEVNGLGTIMSDIEYSTLFFDFAFNYPLPATLVSLEDASKALAYVQSTDNPIGSILVGEAWRDISAPRVVSFSSRGPNPVDPDILKPDLTAPGVDILAAWSPVAPPSIYAEDTRSVKYNIISGTSMSCPHASGAAAYIKSLRPTWSPAAIKSALMTTAYVMNPLKNEDAEFAYGSGHINPVKAVNPGLVYNASEQDYVDFLCEQGYNTTTLRLVTGDSSACTSNATGKGWDLNYPSFALSIEDGQQVFGTFYRTVTNVGPGNSTYYVTVSAPSSLKVTVEPTMLAFSSIGEKKSYKVQVIGGVISQVPIISAEILWKDGVHSVRSPLVVYTVLPPSSPSMGINNKPRSFEGSSIFHKNGILGRH
ncbi:cucumisin-like [Aristolochia californica]|uniref:cucumisin-like n=1 Tax=Aristolochia californica TaxID=171875 RepID=UPI0035D8D005